MNAKVAHYSKSLLDGIFASRLNMIKSMKQPNPLIKDYKILLCLNFLWELPYLPYNLEKSCNESLIWTFLTAIFNLCRTLLSLSLIFYARFVFLNTSLAITFNTFIIFSSAVSWSMFFKRRDILFAIKMLVTVANQVSPRKFKSKWNVYVCMLLNLVGCLLFCTGVIMTGLESYRLMTITQASFLWFDVTDEYKQLFCLALTIAAIVTFIGSAAACSNAVQLNAAMYFHLGDIIMNFGTKLKKRFEYQEINRHFLSENLIMFQNITKLNHIINSAISVNVMFAYGAMVSIFFTGICCLRTFDAKLPALILLVFAIFLFSLYLFFGLTFTGDRVKRKSDELREVVASCSNIILVSNSNEKGIMLFSLMSAEMRSAELHVTGGNMFNIHNGLTLSIAGTLITYGIIIFQMND